MAPPPQPIESALHLGFHFDPKPRDVVTYYLPRLIAGELMHVSIRPYVHAADVYECEPDVLAARSRPTPFAGDRFFFSTCKLQPRKMAGKASRAVRAAGPGSWHTQSATTDVTNGEGVKIGEVRKLRYKKNGAFTDWLMDEVSICSEGPDVAVNRQQPVFCKIYVSPRAKTDPSPTSASAGQEADAAIGVAPPPPPPPPEKAVTAHKKRPAAAPPVAQPPSTKRIRGTADTTASVIPPPSFPSSSRPCVPPTAVRPASAVAPAIVDRPRYMPLQAPAPRRYLPHQPSTRTSTVTPTSSRPPLAVTTASTMQSPSFPSSSRPCVPPTAAPPASSAVAPSILDRPCYMPLQAPAPRRHLPHHQPSTRTSSVAPTSRPPVAVTAASTMQSPSFPSSSRPRVAPTTGCTASAVAPVIAPVIHPVVRRACHTPVPEPAPRHYATLHSSSIVHTTTPAPAPVATRDPFCTESSPAAAQEDDDDDDVEFAKSLADALELEQAEVEVPAAEAEEDGGDDDDDDFAKSLGDSLEQAEGEAQAAEDEDDTEDDLFALPKAAKNQQVHKKREPFEFDPTVGRKKTPMMSAFYA